MAKDKNRFGDSSKKFENSRNDTFYAQPQDENNKVEKSGIEILYDVIYKFNRSFELYVGRQLLKFNAHEVNPYHPESYRNGIPESMINHPDFQIAKSNFITRKRGN